MSTPVTPINPNIQNILDTVEEQVLLGGADALHSLEALFKQYPQIESLLQQGGITEEDAFAKILIQKYPQQFGSYSVAQIVSMMNNYPTVASQITALQSQIGVLQIDQTNDVSTITSTLPVFTNLLTDLTTYIATNQMLPSASLNTLYNSVDQLVSDYRSSASIGTLIADINNVSSAYSGLTANDLSFLAELDPSVAASLPGAVSTATAAASNYTTVTAQIVPLQNQLDEDLAEVALFSGLDPLEQQLLTVLPGVS